MNAYDNQLAEDAVLASLASAVAPAFVVDREGAVVWANEGGRALEMSGGLTAHSRAAVSRIGASCLEGLARLRMVGEATARSFRSSALEFEGRPCTLVEALETPPAPQAEHVAVVAPCFCFIYEIDAEGRLAFLSPDLAQTVGDSAANLVGRAWREIAAALGIDPAGEIARRIDERSAWRDVAIDWPGADGGAATALLLSAMPIFDNGETFIGFRGLGRAAPTIGDEPQPEEGPTVVEAETGELPLQEPGDLPDDIVAPEAPAPEHAVSEGGGLVQDAAEESESVVDGADEPERVVASADQPAEPDAEVPDAFAAFEPESPAPPPVWTAPEHEPPAIVSGAEPVEVFSGNVVSLRDGSVVRPAPGLSLVEESAFDEIARRLNGFRAEVAALDDFAAGMSDRSGDGDGQPSVKEALRLVDRLPLGVIVLSGGVLVYANRAALEMTGAADLEALAARGPQRLFADPLARDGAAPASLRLASDTGEVEVEARLVSVLWRDRPATLVSLKPLAAPDRRTDAGDILESAADGVMTLDSAGRILSVNRSAEALFGFEAREVVNSLFTLPLAPESRRAAFDYLDGVRGDALRQPGRDGVEVVGLSRKGGAIPLYLTIVRIGGGGEARYCAVMRDVTPWKKAEEELIAARREAERASAEKSEFLTRVGREIRTPLTAMIGFAEVMEDERFGPIGSPRYKDYLRDIRLAGRHLVGLVDDLVDLASVEMGRAKLKLEPVDLNEFVQQAAAGMQAQASREHVIIRTSLARSLPLAFADQRSVRQMLTNLVASAVNVSKAGGQVILATSVNDVGQAVIRVRDSGAGMSRRQIALALEPFRTLGEGDTGGLSLSIVKALAEANDARFEIHGGAGEGTVAEITFPATRAVAV